MTRRIRSTSFFAAIVARQSLVALVLMAAMTMASPSTRGTEQSAAEATDGDLDSTFGEGGIVKTDFSGNFDGLGAIAVQPDGKIVLAGSTSNSARVYSFALARYNSDGSLDQSFGSGGRVVTSTGGLASAGSLALLPDGKILAGGVGDAPGSDFAMARFNNDGGLDASFGSNGVVVTNLGSAEIAFDMAVQPDGKIFLGGFAQRGNLQASSFAVVRYKENGRIDFSFGDQGKALVEFSSGFDIAYAIALQPDGKIVLAGTAGLNSGDYPFAITRFNGDGSLDSDFGSGGKITTNFFGKRNQPRPVISMTAASSIWR